MLQSTVTVYLDSSDYSRLSDPRHTTDTLEEVRLELRRLVESGNVCFAFSGAHLSEMAPLEAKYTRAATARADLLVELCGRNAFISFDRLIAQELARLANPELPPVQALSTDGTWFPDIAGVMTPVQWADIVRELNQTIKEQGLNRKQRRGVRRKLFKANQPTTYMRRWLANQDIPADLSDILRLYPMRPQDARVIASYILGKATAKDAENAFLESLRDPRWMIRWFEVHHDELTPVTEWLRGPSRDLMGRMREIASEALELRRIDAILGLNFKPDLLTQKGWHSAQNELLVNVGARLLQSFHPGATSNIEAERIDTYCPGLSTAIRSLHSSIWDSLGSAPRTPKESDFVDAMHGMYAPYVNVFRADRYMAPHIRRQVVNRGVHVASRLEDLPDQIHDLIKKSRS